MKTSLSALFAVCLACGIALLSCDVGVGLGESVDTAAPSLSITYPTDGSVIMNTFTMKGTSADDTSIAKISISVSPTKDISEFTPPQYLATYDAKKKEWECAINTCTNGTWELPDGEYKFNVTARDSAGRTTEKSSVYKIDNTAPIVVLKRPDTDDAYGRTIKVTGDIADQNSLSSLYVTVYKRIEDGTDTNGKPVYRLGDKITTIQQKNISGVGLELIIGKYFAEKGSADYQALSEESKALQAVYEAFYADGTAKGSANVFCTVEVADEALEYSVPSGISSRIYTPASGTYGLKADGTANQNEAADALSGNLSSGYYLYDDIYSEIYSDKGKGLTNADLIKIFNGTYEESRPQSADGAGETFSDTVKDILSLYEIPTAATESTTLDSTKLSQFSINPENFPYFEVSGYKYEATADGTLRFSDIMNEAKITVTVSQGADQVSLVADSIRLSVQRCDEHGMLDASADARTTLIHSIEDIEGMAGEQKTAALNARTSALTKGDSIKIVTGIGYLTAKNYYRVLVDGYDLDGNAVSSEDMFGFYVQPNAQPPVVNLTDAPADLSVTNTAEFTLSGTITQHAQNVELYYSITASDEKGSTVFYYPETAKDGAQNASEVKARLARVSVNDDASCSWTLPITQDLVSIPADSLYLYSVTLRAVDNENNVSGDMTRRIHIDTKAPAIGGISVSPYVSMDANNVPTVNGFVTVKANIDENYEFSETNYRIYTDDTSPVIIQEGRLTGLSIELTNVHTKPHDKKHFLMEFTAVDKAGNYSVTTQKIYVDQDTDKPAVSFSNLDSSVTEESGISDSANMLAQTANNKILGTVTDDDNVHSVTLEYSKDKITWTKFFEKANITTTSYNLSAALVKSLTDSVSLEEGLYYLRCTVTDKDGTDGSITETTETPIAFAVDNNPPTITITDKSGEYHTENFSIHGTATDGSGIKKLVRTKRTSEGHVIQENVEIDVASDGEWTDSITVSEDQESGETIEYTAYDRFNRETKQTFTYLLDRNAPQLSLDKIDDEGIAAVPAGQTVIKYLSQSSHKFSGTVWDKTSATDTNSSDIEAVTYQIYSVADDGTKTAVQDGNGTARFSLQSGATYQYAWSANVDLGSLDNSKTYCVHFTAKDGAENTTTIGGSGSTANSGSTQVSPGTLTLKLDSDAPSFEALWYTYDDEHFSRATGTVFAKQNSPSLIIYGTITDTVSGVQSLTCTIGNSTQAAGTATFSSGEVPQSATGADFAALTWNETLTGVGVTAFKAVIASDKLSTGQLKITPKDIAGNGSAQNTLTIIHDTEEPTIAVSSVTPTVERTENSITNEYVNGTITVSGMASDDNSLKAVTLYVSQLAQGAASGTPTKAILTQR